MNRIVSGLIGAAAGIAGAALFFSIAFLLNWGGLGEEPSTITIPDSPPQLSSVPVTTGSDEVMGPTQIYDRYADSTVQILATFDGPSDFFHAGQEQQGIGSGFVVSDEGYILTNAHVVVLESAVNGEPAVAKTLEVSFKDGKTAEATVVGYDLSGSDVAVLKVDPADLDLVPMVLGDSSTVQVGEPVVAIGSPFGEYASSLTAGIVSATDRTVASPEEGFVIQDAIQTDAAINRGNSGGPLFNAMGEVIGINEQIISESGGFEGVGFAVPINLAKRVMDEIIETGQVEYAWMGVVGTTVDEDVAAELELSVTSGALISDVLADGPSDRAGLKKGDVIIRFDGSDVEKMEDITERLLDKNPGDRVKVTVVRDGETVDIEIELGTRPNSING